MVARGPFAEPLSEASLRAWGAIAMAETDSTISEIWRGDLLGRQEEAINLIAYIESVANRSFAREDKRAYSVAVDAGYGEGKTFFLRRLATQIELNHPVAFVDAWADDLADEPLTALAATLAEALKPFVQKPEVRKSYKAFLSKTGKVASIVAKGLARRGLGLLITGGAVDAAGEVLVGIDDDLKDAIVDGLGAAGTGVADDIADTLSKSPNSVMEKRIADFREGQDAVQQMKSSLLAIIEALKDEKRGPPIVILIDELDRCRPTYAIKLLEEIKHLFDVPGLVFVLAMNAEQLGHSVCGAYGSEFDGRAYLRRFIDREYRLAEPNLEPLLEVLCRQANLDQNRYQFFQMGETGTGGRPTKLPEALGIYCHAYGLGARDAFELIDKLQTCQALTVMGRPMILPYLLPLIIGSMKGSVNRLPTPVKSSAFVYFVRRDERASMAEEVSIEGAAAIFDQFAQLDEDQLLNRINEENAHRFAKMVWAYRDQNARSQPIWSINRYSDLIRTVGRFSNPNIDG